MRTERRKTRLGMVQDNKEQIKPWRILNNLLTELWKGQFNLRMRLEKMLLKLALK